MNSILFLSIFLVVGTASSVYAAFFAWRRNEIAGNQAFSLAMLMLGWWGFAYAAELAASNIGSKLFWARLEHVALPAIPLFFKYTAITVGHKWPKSVPHVALLFVIPIITNILVWLYQPLIWSNVTETTIAGTLQLQYENGPWTYVSTHYNLVLYLMGAILIFPVIVKSPRLTRIESGLLLFGIVAPFIVNLPFVLDLPISNGLNFTPLAALTFGIVAAAVVFEVRPISYLPIVQDVAFQSLPDSAMTVDKHNRVRLFNPEAIRQMIRLGLDPNAARGRTMADVMPDHWFELFKVADEHNTVIHEVKRYLPDDKINYIDVRLTPMRDQRNRFRGRLIVFRNITELKNEQIARAKRGKALEKAVAEQTAELRRVNANLLQAVRTKDEFLAGMSHELRTPLNAIIGTSEALRETVYGKVPAAMAAPLERIDFSAGHLLELINDILDMTRVEAGTLELVLEAVVLEEICDTCLGMVRYEATKKQIETMFSIDVQQMVLHADSRRLRQILLNLLSNAIKFTPGGGQIGLEVTEVTDAQTTQFTVWDTGIGIAEDDQERVFDSFVQVDSSLSRNFDGTGLGLALTRNLVEMHGGKIELVSQLGVGSRFTVCLPWNLDSAENTKFRPNQPPAKITPAK